MQNKLNAQLKTRNLQFCIIVWYDVMLKPAFLAPQVKQMAAVLLRRLLSSSFEEIYPGLTLEMQTAIKTELLTGIQQETSATIRKKICDIAAELSRNLIGDNPQIFQTLE